MAGDIIKEVLLETGWQSSFAFPTASKENIKLLELLTETKAKITETSDELEMYVEKNKKLQGHVDMVKNERKLTAQLKEEVDKEIADSEHFIKMAEQENWRTASDHKRLIEQKKKLISRLGALEDEIFLKSNKLTSIKTELDCDQKRVEQFMTDCEMDHALKKRLQTIFKTDNTLIQHLISEENKLNAKRNDLLKKLDTAVSKDEVIQLRIDTTAEMGREENRGRQEMLQLWEKTVKQLSDRDADFTKLGNDYDGLLSDINERQTKMHALQKLLGSIGQDIKDVKHRSSLLTKEANDIRQATFQESVNSTTTENELLTLKKLVSKVSKDLQQMRAANAHFKESNKKLSENLQTTEGAVVITLRKLENLKMEHVSAEELLRMVEEELEAEIQCQNTVKLKLTKLKNLRFIISEEKRTAENDNKTVEALINGGRTKIRHADRELQSSEAELKRLEQLVYKAMLTANLIERRIARMESSVACDEESAALERRIRHMQEQFDSQCQSAHTLTSMIEQFKNEKRVLGLQSDSVREQLRRGIYQMDGVKVYLANAGRSLDGAIRSRNEILVFYNLCRYQLRRAEERYRLMAETTLSAEMRAKAIATLTRELEEEASARTYRVEMEMRMAGQDASRIKADLAKRKCRLDQLKSRYDVDASMISADGDIDKAQTSIIVKSLEEHEELQARGDELDRDVKRAEEELRALENTVHVMTSLNESARSFSGTTIDQSLLKNKEVLTEKLDETTKKLKVSREKRRILRASVLRFTVEISSLEEEIAQLEKMVASYEADVFRIRNKNFELDAKLERALKVRTLAKTKATRVKQPVDLDIEVQLLSDFNESVNILLVRSIKASPFINNEILIRAQELSKNFQLTTPVLVGSADNIKASDRILNRNINANASRSGSGNLAVASVELSLRDVFDAPRPPTEKTATRVHGGGRAKPPIRSMGTPSSASSDTLSIRSIH
ncbi:Coiled-coil domain-containing protein 39 [Taenia crassiceps]|uniref:Coiled-coil domain-containing protein 39 n=1 Tax=Taenia crassiceps TaxID=6207 RepID=A0ABR4QHI5_9CEST